MKLRTFDNLVINFLGHVCIMALSEPEDVVEEVVDTITEEYANFLKEKKMAEIREIRLEKEAHLRQEKKDAIEAPFQKKAEEEVEDYKSRRSMQLKEVQVTFLYSYRK